MLAVTGSGCSTMTNEHRSDPNNCQCLSNRTKCHSNSIASSQHHDQTSLDINIWEVAWQQDH